MMKITLKTVLKKSVRIISRKPCINKNIKIRRPKCSDTVIIVT